ncbi:MAG TPA: Hsp20/alpha crystallin family protein [Xanthobacteraceae bacterium]|nr:Hsp20/alpha crystallin family protein [Xanthobacteraceae bacterium]
MAEAATKLPIKTEAKETAPAVQRPSHPFESLRREVDRLFDDFGTGFWRAPFRRSLFDVEPFWNRELTFGTTPAVDVVEKDKTYEITAELPGMDEKNVEVLFSDGVLTIKGEKQEEKEEKKKDYYMSERRYGSFRRSFEVPEGVDAEKIEASFKNGVLSVTLPKSPEAQKKEKKIPVTAK